MFQICNILNPNSPLHIKQMARSLFLLGRHKLAIEAYKQAEARTAYVSHSEDWEIAHNMGVCYMYDFHWDYMMTDKFGGQKPKFKLGRTAKTFIYTKKPFRYLKHFDQAISQLRRALDLHKNEGSL